MRRSVFSIGWLLVLFLSVHAGGQDIEPATNRTKRLAEWESLHYGMFIHFGMSTFTGNEIDPGDAPSSVYAPTRLDVRQWVRVAREAGMKYIVLTAKHVPGHCLWNSHDYDYDVATSSNKTDVVAAFMAACKAEGIRPGIYYCVLDGHNEGGVKWKEAVTDEYFELIKRHLTELHRSYPGIFEQWIDIPGKLSPGQRWTLYRLVKRLSPDCIVMMNHGFTDGVKIPVRSWPTDLTNGERTLPPATGHDPVKEVDGKKYYIPMEVCDTIGRNWFWVPDDAPRPVKTLYYMYTRCMQRGANLLLNVPPDKTGRIPERHVKALMDLGKVIKDPSLLPPPESLAFGGPVKASNVYKKMSRYGPAAAVDDDHTTRWATDADVRACWLQVDLGEKKTFDRARISEAYDRSRKFVLEYRKEGTEDTGATWRIFAEGTKIGKGVALAFEPITARHVRLRFIEATGGPTVWEFELLKFKKN
jgi:alpha-L-fucosidase